LATANGIFKGVRFSTIDMTMVAKTIGTAATIDYLWAEWPWNVEVFPIPVDSTKQRRRRMASSRRMRFSTIDKTMVATTIGAAADATIDYSWAERPWNVEIFPIPIDTTKKQQRRRRMSSSRRMRFSIIDKTMVATTIGAAAATIDYFMSGKGLER
jgi:hypothetical protein